MADFPAIPVPTEDPKALLASVLTLKKAVEMLTAQDQGNNGASHVWIQADAPNALNPGDLWLCTSTAGWSFNIWNDSKWIKIVDASPDGSMLASGTPDLLLSQFARRRR